MNLIDCIYIFTQGNWYDSLQKTLNKCTYIYQARVRENERATVIFMICKKLN